MEGQDKRVSAGYIFLPEVSFSGPHLGLPNKSPQVLPILHSEKTRRRISVRHCVRSRCNVAWNQQLLGNANLCPPPVLLHETLTQQSLI